MRHCVALLLLASVAAVADTELPAYVIELPDSVQDVFVADAGNAILYRFRHDDDVLTAGEETYMSVGQRGVGKERAWDQRTPLGIYFVVDQLDTSRLHEKYGVTAFPLDYPNEWDRLNERTGDGIWVHGVLPGEEPRPPFDTDGCLALPNDELTALEPRFVPLITPVIVTREIEWMSDEARAALRSDLRDVVERWVSSIAEADLHAYLSLYAEDFTYRGMSTGEWATLRLSNFEQTGAVEVAIEDLLLLADPEESELYLSRFRQTIVDANGRIVTTKRLYWRRSLAGVLQIVAEDNG